MAGSGMRAARKVVAAVVSREEEEGGLYQGGIV